MKATISTPSQLAQTLASTAALTGTLASLALLVLAGGFGAGVAAAEPSALAKKPPPAVSVEMIAPRLFEQRPARTGSIETIIIAELSSPAEGAKQRVAECC